MEVGAYELCSKQNSFQGYPSSAKQELMGLEESMILIDAVCQLLSMGITVTGAQTQIWSSTGLFPYYLEHPVTSSTYLTETLRQSMQTDKPIGS